MEEMEIMDNEVKIPVEETTIESGIEVAGKVKSGELEEDKEIIEENKED